MSQIVNTESEMPTVRIRRFDDINQDDERKDWMAKGKGKVKVKNKSNSFI
jgi:hypothetical protein